jgi:hypothetical protein
VIEFNTRFGDPETQVVLPLMQTDLVDVCLAVADGKLDSQPVNWYDKKALCVVMASGGYPGDYEKGKVITGIEDAENTGALVFRALGVTAISLGGEVAPGIPWGRPLDGTISGLSVVTKSGGFGEEDALIKVAEFLSKL